MKTFKKFIGAYLLLGAVISFFLFLFTQENIFYYFIPNVIALVVFSFYILSAYRFIKYPDSILSKSLLYTTLIIQSIQLDFLALYLKVVISLR